MLQMEITVIIITATFQLIVGLLTGYLLYKMQRRDSKRDREEEESKKKHADQEKARQVEYTSIKRGMLAVLTDRLTQSCQNFLGQGWIPVHELGSIGMMYDAYSDLGGNGIVSRLYEKVKLLPTVHEEGD